MNRKALIKTGLEVKRRRVSSIRNALGCNVVLAVME